MTDATLLHSAPADGLPSKQPVGKPVFDWVVPLLLFVAIFAAIVGSLCIGAFSMSFWKAGRIVLNLAWPFPLQDNPPWTPKELAVVELIRLPRVLLATLTGLALGISGTALQGIMRNPLVGPDLVGVSSGAACGCMLAILFNLPPTGVIAIAFCGGLLAMICTFGLTRAAGAKTDGVALIMTGIFIGAFCMACVGLALFLANDTQLGDMVFWLYGNFARAEPKSVWMLAIPALAGGAILMLLRWRLNLLSLGELDASSLGVNTQAVRWSIIAIVTLIIAAQVSVSGVIGWIGLVIPHCARMLVGPDHRKLLPASALLGALFTLGIDDFTRVVIRSDVPIGVMTALVGTPIMCFLFWKTQTKGWTDE
jgi:iron complex transport system permease protein